MCTINNAVCSYLVICFGRKALMGNNIIEIWMNNFVEIVELHRFYEICEIFEIWTENPNTPDEIGVCSGGGPTRWSWTWLNRVRWIQWIDFHHWKRFWTIFGIHQSPPPEQIFSNQIIRILPNFAKYWTERRHFVELYEFDVGSVNEMTKYTTTRKQEGILHSISKSTKTFLGIGYI